MLRFFSSLIFTLACLVAVAGCTSRPAAPPLLQAWAWDGQTARPVVVPPGTRLAQRPDHLLADLRGDGEPLAVALDERGIVEVRDGSSGPLLWRNEAADWRITRIDAGDPNDDGRIEVLLLLWKAEDRPAAAAGESSAPLRSHPFLLGWRGGRYRIIWGGSATQTPIQDLALGNPDGDRRHELVVLEGGHMPGDAAEYVSVWHWHGWGFQKEWQSPPGRWRAVALQDINGDGRAEIVALPFSAAADS